MFHRLSLSFYERPATVVAKELIGKLLVNLEGKQCLVGRIVEVEAYRNVDDPASHAHRGRTGRNSVMFGRPGHAYVYFIYGMYFCFNVVTETEGVAGACLIRAVEPLEGIGVMSRRRKCTSVTRLTNGPGKLCIAFGIGRRHNGSDLTTSNLFIASDGYVPDSIARSPRIGIRQATEKPWRFYSEGHPCLSVRS